MHWILFHQYLTTTGLKLICATNGRNYICQNIWYEIWLDINDDVHSLFLHGLGVRCSFCFLFITYCCIFFSKLFDTKGLQMHRVILAGGRGVVLWEISLQKVYKKKGSINSNCQLFFLRKRLTLSKVT